MDEDSAVGGLGRTIVTGKKSCL